MRNVQGHLVIKGMQRWALWSKRQGTKHKNEYHTSLGNHAHLSMSYSKGEGNIELLGRRDNRMNPQKDSVLALKAVHSILGLFDSNNSNNEYHVTFLDFGPHITV